MADSLDHQLELQSRVGHGSRFSVTAPYATLTSNAEPMTAAASPDSTYLVSKPLIVIDNDLSVLGAMQTLLSRWGADVRLARDLDDVNDILADRSFSPAIILADYHLDGPVLGVDAVARIRQGLGSPVPAILITADRDQATAKAAQQSNCELLYKPVRPAELRALMQHLLA
jgi:DNA-binding response OmpR family regulator